jgi:hypothetical protein
MATAVRTQQSNLQTDPQTTTLTFPSARAGPGLGVGAEALTNDVMRSLNAEEEYLAIEFPNPPTSASQGSSGRTFGGALNDTSRTGVPAPTNTFPVEHRGRLTIRPSAPGDVNFVQFDRSWESGYLDATTVAVIRDTGPVSLLAQFATWGLTGFCPVVYWNKDTGRFYTQDVHVLRPGGHGDVHPLALDPKKVKCRLDALQVEWTRKGPAPNVSVEEIDGYKVLMDIPPSLFRLTPGGNKPLCVDIEYGKRQKRQRRGFRRCDAQECKGANESLSSNADEDTHIQETRRSREGGEKGRNGKATQDSKMDEDNSDENEEGTCKQGGLAPDSSKDRDMLQMHKWHSTCLCVGRSCCECLRTIFAGLGSVLAVCVSALRSVVVVAAHGILQFFLGAMWMMAGLHEFVMYVLRGNLCVIDAIPVRQCVSASLAVGAIVQFSVASWLATNPVVPAVCGFIIYIPAVWSASTSQRGLPMSSLTDLSGFDFEEAKDKNMCLWRYVAVLVAWSIFSFIAMFTIFNVLSFSYSWIYMGGHICACLNLWISAVNK